MHKVEKANFNGLLTHVSPFPHCDQRILHAPGECEYCDKHKDWQALRVAWGIAFTGWQADEKELPCPADHARGDKHQQWGGNVARPTAVIDKPAFLSGFTVVGGDSRCTCGTSLMCPIHQPQPLHIGSTPK